MSLSRPMLLALIGTVLAALTFLVGASARERATDTEVVSDVAPPPQSAEPSKPGQLASPQKLSARQRAAAARRERSGGKAAKAKVPAPAKPRPGRKSAAPGVAAPAPARAKAPKVTPEPASARAPRGVPAPVGKALREKKVMVLLVTGRGADDSATAAALRSVRSMKGVATFKVPIKRLPSYRRVIVNLNVSQAPALAVVDRKRQARLFEGFFDSGSLRQAVIDAR